MEIVDNFLPSHEFKDLRSNILGDYFPWYFNEGILSPIKDPFRVSGYHDVGKYQFTHTFFIPQQKPSKWYSIIHSCLGKIRPKKLFRIKANLNPKTLSHESGGYHIDIKNASSSSTTSIMYINTNNGWTEFENGDKVECVENRMVFFDSNIKHNGVSCTDQLRKVVINFNYER